MYIEIHDWDEFEQKELYFKIHNALNMNIKGELNRKIIGVYAIFKKKNCLYVGQSKNLASRIATHLRGKYKEATEIFLFDIQEVGFDDFLKRSKDSQKAILDNAEKYLMKLLKPIDNIDIDMDFNLDDKEKPIVLDDDQLSIQSQYRIIPFTNDPDNILIIQDSYSSPMFLEIHETLLVQKHKSFVHNNMEYLREDIDETLRALDFIYWNYRAVRS